MEHYVYRITNIKLKKHYYGVRTSKFTSAEEDIGLKYFSSSQDEDFILEQKTNRCLFKYKVIKKFKTRYLAENYEMILHKKFSVSKNDNFYNKCNATENGFSVQGKMTVKDLNGNMIGSVDVNHPEVLAGNWVHHSTGKKLLVSHKDKISKKSKGLNNSNSNNITDEEILEYYLELTLKLNRIPTMNVLRIYVKENYNRNIPKFFTKFRFPDKKPQLIMEEKTGLKYNPHYRSEEQKQKISKANLGKQKTEIEKENISKGLKKMYKDKQC